MSRRIKAFLLAASAACALPIVATPAQAFIISGGCAFVAVADQTDEQGPRTWIELTYSVFVGTPDITQWEITCWLQTEASMLAATNQSTNTGQTSWNTCSSPNHFKCPENNWASNGELPNTRHTCSGTAPAGACANPVIFEIFDTQNVYQCQHIEWTGSITDDPTNIPFDLIDHFLRDLFSTGGVTTLGGQAQITATLLLAVTNLVATLTGGGLPGLPGPAEQHSELYDYDDNIAGPQCDTVISA